MWMEGRRPMARPIEVTPVLKGKDARVFMEQTQNVVVTKERVEWLKSVAEQSKKAEKDK
jgi:hypothetical protein